jgi:hypothetical protein
MMQQLHDACDVATLNRTHNFQVAENDGTAYQPETEDTVCEMAPQSGHAPPLHHLHVIAHFHVG